MIIHSGRRVLFGTMVINFVTEFSFCRRKTINTNKLAERDRENARRQEKNLIEAK